jgi:hypothetical protein
VRQVGSRDHHGAVQLRPPASARWLLLDPFTRWTVPSSPFDDSTIDHSLSQCQCIFYRGEKRERRVVLSHRAQRTSPGHSQ